MQNSDTIDFRPPIRLGALLKDATRQLEGTVESAPREAEILLAWLLQKDRSFFRAFAEHPIEPDTAQRYLTLVRFRANGQPIAYLTGFREFWSLDFEVSPDVLIPRPETETLVEQILASCTPKTAPALLDLGTGCGTIAVSLARARPDARVTALERNPAALKVAIRNARRHLVENRVRFIQGDWLAPFRKTPLFDCIASNPPYLASEDPHLGQGDLRFEPLEALASGPDGLDAIRHIANNARPYLKARGVIALEHGLDQAPAVQQLLRNQGFEDVRTIHDLEGRPRVTLGSAPDRPEMHAWNYPAA